MTRIEWVHHPLRKNGFTPFHAEPRQNNLVPGDNNGVADVFVAATGLVGALVIVTEELPAATVGTTYSHTLRAIGGAPPYTWAVASGSLPAGLGLNSSTGEISGSPTAVGTFDFQIQISDSATPSQSGTRTLSLTVTPPPSINISSVAPSSPSLAQGGSATINVSILRTDFTGSVTLSLSSLPAGVTASISQPGTGNFGTVTLHAASNASLVTNQTITITASGSGVSAKTADFNLTVTAPSGKASLSSSALSFGGQLVGTTSAAQTITLNNTGDAPLTITSILATATMPRPTPVAVRLPQEQVARLR